MHLQFLKVASHIYKLFTSKQEEFISYLKVQLLLSYIHTNTHIYTCVYVYLYIYYMDMYEYVYMHIYVYMIFHIAAVKHLPSWLL